MDYEKAYKEALEKAKELAIDGYLDAVAVNNIFPELAESEDEKMRKKLIHIVSNHNTPKWYGLEVKNVIAWLEKQGEQKLVIVPKFRIGDKIKKGYLTYTVEDIDYDLYKLQADSKDGNHGCTVFLTIGNEDGYELVEQKPVEWSKEDKSHLGSILYLLHDYIDKNPDTAGADIHREDIVWLKSIRPQKQWKPSEEMLEALYRAIPENTMAISEDEMLLDKLYQGLKYGRVLSNN